MSNVIDLPTTTTLKIHPDKVLNAAIGNLDTCIVIGETDDGDFYLASSEADKAVIIYLLELTKAKLLNGEF